MYQVICGLPWEPPCYETSCDLTTLLSKKCDLMVLSPESYYGYCDDACIAKATVQFGKITFGKSSWIERRHVYAATFALIFYEDTV